MFSYKILFLFFWIFFFTGIFIGKCDDLESFRAAFLHAKMSREAYLDYLVKLRYEYVWNGGRKGNSIINDKISAINDEMKTNLLPSDSNGQSLSRLRVGKWESPRHPYLYRPNHTWIMLPIEGGDPQGLWKIEGNRYYDWAPLYSPNESTCLIILLDAKYFVFTDGHIVFYEKRLN